MKVKLFHLFYITAFIALCLLPFVAMALFGPSGEAEAPKLLEDGGINLQYMEDAEDYVAEGFALRPELRTIWAALNGKLLHTCVDDRVILGTDGWLYGGATAEDYMGITADADALYYASTNLALMQEYAQSKGARFLFTMVPNKNSLYPAYMPDRYPAGEQSNAALLTALLEERNVNDTDLFTVLRQEESVLYYKTDSRWTARGAALGADTILQQLQKSTSYFDGEFLTKTHYRGDLYRMLYPAGVETEPVETYAEGFGFTVTYEGDDGAVTTEREGVHGSLLCLHDDFGYALRPYLAEVSNRGLFSPSMVYDLTAVEAQDADAVIVVLAESNLHRLWEYAPVMPAPVRKVTSEAYGEETLPAMGSRAGDLWGLTVTIPKEAADSGSGLYIKIGETVYEGCVVCREDTLTCSVYVTEALPKVVELIVLSDGVYTTYSCMVGE